MTEPELFDVIELLVDLPAFNLRVGEGGAIVECLGDGKYEVVLNLCLTPIRGDLASPKK